ncbi:MAG TPA: hypothetical protein VLT85_08935 [Terriglobales bacterium]|nr:hypothetical protein [Terriglobales bacterium]
MRNLGSLLLLASTLTFAQAAQPAPQPPTEISADLGSCSAEFHVTDLAGHGLYNAKIHTLIRYGFWSKRKLELEAGTNAAGHARFVKLPDQIKKPMVFDIHYQDQKVTQSYDPGVDCHASYDVPLKVDGKNAK